MEPKKFTVDELLEDAMLSLDNTDNDEARREWQAIVDFLLEYKHTERTSEFIYKDHIEQEDDVEWNTNMSANDED